MGVMIVRVPRPPARSARGADATAGARARLLATELAEALPRADCVEGDGAGPGGMRWRAAELDCVERGMV